AGRQVVMAGDGDQRAPEAPGHVLDETRLAAAGGPLDHHRQLALVALLEDGDLIRGGQVPGRAGLGRAPRAVGHYPATARTAGPSGPAGATPNRGGCRKTSMRKNIPPTANRLAVATSIRKCTWTFSWVSRKPRPMIRSRYTCPMPAVAND